MRRCLECSRILQVLLLVAAWNHDSNNNNKDTSFSAAAYSPTSRISSSSMQKKFSFHPQQRIRPTSLASTKDEYTRASDDRRNQSLEQGNHPLWSLNLNLDSLAQAGAGSRAQELLKRIHALYTEGYYDVSPDIVSYNSVLKAWKEDEQPQAALELLETMIRNEQKHENVQDDESKTIRVDVISFNTVIAAFANQGDYAKALEILRKMQKKKSLTTSEDSDNNDNDNDNDEFEDYYYPDPDTITYNIVLYSLAQSEDLGAAPEAENLLREMMMRKERSGVSVVDTTSFNTVLYAWSKEGEKNANSLPIQVGKKTVKKRRPVSAETAAQRAEDLLTIMEELSEAGNLKIRPDVYSYTTTIQCWARCRSFADKAQTLLNRMIDRDLQPNKLTYSALMNALSKAGNPEKAEYVLHQMIRSHHQPDTVAFSSIIDGWAKVSSKDRPEAASRALQILETMRRNSATKPSATTYTSVLNALAKSGQRDACDTALKLLQDMEENYSMHPNADYDDDYDDDDKWSIRPTNIHYNCVLNAYARSGRADKAIRAQKLMGVMENHSRLDCRPDTISYNSLMMACGHATGSQKLREESFEIALRTFKILVSKGGKQAESLLHHKPVHDLYPTSSTFANFFRACRKLLRPENERRDACLTKGLDLCKKLGMLNFLVVHQVQLACQSQIAWKKIAGDLSDHVGWKEDFKRVGNRVPREWTCNSRR